jgi:cytochrome d ubiquinol oxidase subunit II
MAGYALAGVWLAVGIEGYASSAITVTDGPSNPLLLRGGEARQAGSPPMRTGPWIAIAPIMGFARHGVLAFLGLRAGREVSTLLWSKLGILGVISSVGLTMFPFILPSSSTRSHR